MGLPGARGNTRKAETLPWPAKDTAPHHFCHLSPFSDKLLGHCRGPGPWRAILSRLCLQPVFVAPLSGCLRQALLYFRPDITQQAVKTGYSLTLPRWEQLP